MICGVCRCCLEAMPLTDACQEAIFHLELKTKSKFGHKAELRRAASLNAFMQAAWWRSRCIPCTTAQYMSRQMHCRGSHAGCTNKPIITVHQCSHSKPCSSIRQKGRRVLDPRAVLGCCRSCTFDATPASRDAHETGRSHRYRLVTVNSGRKEAVLRQGTHRGHRLSWCAVGPCDSGTLQASRAASAAVASGGAVLGAAAQWSRAIQYRMWVH